MYMKKSDGEKIFFCFLQTYRVFNLAIFDDAPSKCILFEINSS